MIFKLFKRKKCQHKWVIPRMYRPGNFHNPTYCVKCLKTVINIDLVDNCRDKKIKQPGNSGSCTPVSKESNANSRIRN